MSSFNHEWNHFKLRDAWPQWTRVKRCIGAANSSKKPIKNREIETLVTRRIGRHWECSYSVGIVSQEWWAVNTGVSLCQNLYGDRREQEVVS